MEDANVAGTSWSGFSKTVCVVSKEDASSLVPWLFFSSVNFVLDNFASDPAIVPINASSHLLVRLCRSICAGDRPQILDLVMNIKDCLRIFSVFA